MPSIHEYASKIFKLSQYPEVIKFPKQTPSELESQILTPIIQILSNGADIPLILSNYEEKARGN